MESVALTNMTDNQLSAALRLWEYKREGAASNLHFDHAAKMVKAIDRELSRRFPERTTHDL